MIITLNSEECKALLEAIVDCDMELFNKIEECAESDDEDNLIP
jgi:hypothetical protein